MIAITAANSSALKRSTKIPYAGKEAKKLPVPGPKAPDASAADSFPSVYPYKGTRIVARGFGDVAVFGPVTQKIAGTPTWPDADRLFEQDTNVAAQFTSLDLAMKWVDDTVGKMVNPRCVGIPVDMQTQNRKELTDEERARVEKLTTDAAAKAKPDAEGPEAQAFKAQQAELKKAKTRTRKLNETLKATTTSVPLTGKAAIAAIKGKRGAPSSAKKKPGATKVAAKPKKRAGKAPGAKAAGSKPAKTAKAADGGLRPGSKAEKIAQLLLRKDGTTAAEVMKACDWPSVSMPAQAKAAGLKLTKKKVDGVNRYYGAK